MIESYTELLEKNNILPLSNWKVFTADHSKEKIKGLRKEEHIEHIKMQANKIPGVYMYFDGDECLYVGIASNLSGRFIDHYKESWNEAPKGRNNQQFAFFNQYRIPLRVLWFEIENEFNRFAIEAMLTRIYNPKYINFRKGTK